MPATDASRPRPSNSLSHRDLVDELLFYDASGETVHVLNGPARDIYLLCDGTRSIGDIAAWMFDHYEVDRVTAAADARRMVDELVALGVLEEA